MNAKVCMGSIHTAWNWKPEEKDGVVAKQAKMQKNLLESRIRPKRGRILQGQFVILGDDATYLDLYLCKGDENFAMDTAGAIYKREFDETTGDFKFWSKVESWQG